jgi:hypothetical protein
VTEGSIFQNSATTIVQGYIEHIKNMEFSALPYYNSSGTLVAGSGSTTNEIATRLDDVTPDPLLISSGSPPALSNIIPGGTTPNGVIDNLKSININQTTNTSDDLQLKLWVWVQDISDSSIGATQVRAITIIYQWRFASGSSTRWYIGTVRSIRSAVITF